MNKQENCVCANKQENHVCALVLYYCIARLQPIAGLICSVLLLPTHFHAAL